MQPLRKLEELRSFRTSKRRKKKKQKVTKEKKVKLRIVLYVTKDSSEKNCEGQNNLVFKIFKLSNDDVRFPRNVKNGHFGRNSK